MPKQLNFPLLHCLKSPLFICSLFSPGGNFFRPPLTLHIRWLVEQCGIVVHESVPRAPNRGSSTTLLRGRCCVAEERALLKLMQGVIFLKVANNHYRLHPYTQGPLVTSLNLLTPDKEALKHGWTTLYSCPWLN